MKKTLILLVSCILSITAIAQSHIKFKGIELKYSYGQMLDKLVEAGFTVGYDDGVTTDLTGEFAGCKRCFVSIENDDFVWRVLVIMPLADEYESEKKERECLINSYITKYGEPTSDKSYVICIDDSMNDCKDEREVKWVLNEGVISMTLGSSSVSVMYEDNETLRLLKENNAMKVSDDI